MHNSDSKNIISALVGDAIKRGITDPAEVVNDIAGTYTINRKEIVIDGKSDQNSRRNGNGSNRGKERQG